MDWSWRPITIYYEYVSRLSNLTHDYKIPCSEYLWLIDYNGMSQMNFSDTYGTWLLVSRNNRFIFVSSFIFFDLKHIWGLDGIFPTFPKISSITHYW
jgi:hypothetical protein